MTYKALRRKSDKQWMGINLAKRFKGIDAEMFECYFPDLYLLTANIEALQSSHPSIDWSLYELVIVHVIAEDELPSDEKIESEIVDLFGKNDISVGIIAGIKAYKSQILKP